MSLVCPISNNNIDENVARLNASITLLLVLVFLLTPFKWIIFFIGIDFILRRIEGGKFSLIARTSRATTGALGFRKISINAGPKLFAANIGFLFSILIAGFYYGGLVNVSYVIAGILAFFTIMESVFNICAACILYPLVSKFMG
jgi:hypothetical protein